MSHDSAKLTRVYLKMRDKKKALNKAHDAEIAELEDQMQIVENLMLGTLIEQKAKSIATAAGTFFVETLVKPSCNDWEAYRRWMVENDALDGLEKRVTKTFIVDYMKAHDDETPPGIVVYREKAVRVRVGND